MTGGVLGAVLAAVVASILFGASAAFMAFAAFSAPQHIKGIWALLRHLGQNRLWLIGMGASLLGLGLHVVALSLGPLTVVQPVVVTSLVFSFFFRSALERRLPGRGTVVGAAVTTAGLILFLTAADIGHVDAPARIDGDAALAALVVGGLAAAGAAAWAHAAGGPRSAFLTGLAAGVVFGLLAGALKATTVEASSGVGHLLFSWPLYVLAVLGASGFILNQRAYRTYSLNYSLPALNTMNPLVALIFGHAVFGDPVAHTLVALLAEGVGLALITTGIVVVSATGEPDADADAAPAPTPDRSRRGAPAA